MHKLRLNKVGNYILLREDLTQASALHRMEDHTIASTLNRQVVDMKVESLSHNNLVNQVHIQKRFSLRL